MHELSLCRSIHTIAERAAPGRTVQVIHLRVGQLRQVVPETLTYCWSLVTETGPLAGSRLDIDHVPVVLDCDGCGTRTEVADVLMLTCGQCGSGAIEVRTGTEFEVTSLDLVPLPDGPAPNASTELAKEHR